MTGSPTFYLLWICLFPLRNTLAAEETSFEVCDLEKYIARCPYDQQIIITQALYGHIKLGKCTERDIGFFGCYADVRDILDERCTGKPRCEISMPDAEIKATKPCPGLITYLESSFACIPDTLRPSCNGLHGTRKTQYLTSNQILKLDCLGKRNHISFDVDEHLHLKFTLERISQHGSNTTGNSGYFSYQNGENISFSFSDQETKKEFIIPSSSTGLELSNEDIILIGFQAIGCEMLQPPAYTWMEREGDVTTLGCNNNQYTWQLRCIGNKWIGAVGNCTENKVIVEIPKHTKSDEQEEENEIADEIFSREIQYAIVIGITVFLCVVVITVGYVCLKRARYQAKAQNSTELQTIVYDGSDTNSWARGTMSNGKSQQAPNAHPNSWQPTLMKPFINEQNGSLTNKSQKYYVVDQDYVNASGFPNS